MDGPWTIRDTSPTHLAVHTHQHEVDASCRRSKRPWSYVSLLAGHVGCPWGVMAEHAMNGTRFGKDMGYHGDISSGTTFSKHHLNFIWGYYIYIYISICISNGDKKWDRFACEL